MEYICFKTSGDWTVDEWNSFLTSISKIYNAFLSMEIVQEFERGIPDSFTMSKLTVSEVLKNPQFFVDDNAILRIHEIKMASPGSINLKGSGEIIKETRELVESYFPTKITKAKIETYNAETKKIEAEAKKIEAEAKKIDAEVENIKAKTDQINSKIMSENLKNISKLVSIVSKYPLFKRQPIQDDENKNRKVILDQLTDGIVGFITLLKNGKIIDIQ